MSGVVELRGDRAWIVAGWVYRRVIKVVSTRLPADSPIRRRLEQATEPNLEFLSLQEWPASDLIELHRAASSAYAQEQSDGPTGWAAFEAFQSYMVHFSEFVELLVEGVHMR